MPFMHRAYGFWLFMPLFLAWGHVQDLLLQERGWIKIVSDQIVEWSVHSVGSRGPLKGPWWGLGTTPCFKFQVYFIISSNSSPRAELQDKITLHNNIFKKKDTSKHVYTQQNVDNIKIFKNTHIALWHYLNYNTKQQNGTQSDGLEQQDRPGQG